MERTNITEFDWRDWNELNNCINSRKEEAHSLYSKSRLSNSEYKTICNNLSRLKRKVRWQLQKRRI